MAKVPIALRLQPEVLERLDAYARQRSSSRQQVLEAAVEAFLGLAEGGVPDLPAEPEPASRVVKRVPGVVRARVLAPADPVALARQARLNGERS